MSGPSISGDAFAGKPSIRSRVIDSERMFVGFKYTGDAKVLMTVDVDMDADLLIVGQPGNGSYEWVIVNHGSIEKHSDCGYGQKSIALRDGLIAYHGLTEIQEAAPDLLAAVQDLIAVLNPDPSLSVVKRAEAAIKKAGV